MATRKTASESLKLELTVTVDPSNYDDNFVQAINTLKEIVQLGREYGDVESAVISGIPDTLDITDSDGY